MKRFLSAVFLCLSLLVTVSFIIVHRATAKEDPILLLLEIPAPPPRNPWMPVSRRDDKFFSKLSPPGDDAPIDDLLDYWARRNSEVQALRYSPNPSERTLSRILDEIDRDPTLLPKYFKLLADSKRGIETAKRIYDSGIRLASEEEYDPRGSIREWLTNNSTYYAENLESMAGSVDDTQDYVADQDSLMDLARVDWERARPVVDRMYNNNSAPVSQVLARWALYRQAIKTDSIDVERYRDELKAIVEDRKAKPGARDLALDALVSEPEWPGRDEWYYSLLSDETLAELRVGGSVHTGLTTLILVSPEDKYVDKMIEFTRSDNIVVRTAAVRNLLIVMSAERPQITRALLPWLSDPKWVNTAGDEDQRVRLINSLASVKMPESVPALIAALDEKVMVDVPESEAAANTPYRNYRAANAVRAAANAANAAANAVATAANTAAVYTDTERFEIRSSPSNANTAVNAPHVKTIKIATYPLRPSAINALGFQGDFRAVPALRRMLSLAEKEEKRTIVMALLQCNGFTVEEQVRAIEAILRKIIANQEAIKNNANAAIPLFADTDPIDLLGAAILLEPTTPKSDEFVAAILARADVLEKSDPELAEALRGMLATWKGPAVEAALIRELRSGKQSAGTVIALLARRKELLERLPSAVHELRNGPPIAVAVLACMTESESEYAQILAGENSETKAALLACARLIRGRLPLGDVIPLLHSTDKRLALAAEAYLEVEDSPEARAAVLSIHPGEAKILGAATAFGGKGSGLGGEILTLFASVNEYFAGKVYISQLNPNEDKAKELGEELKASTDLLGIYSYADSTIRIYRDRAAFSWSEDPSRYRERKLEPAEFDNLKGYLAHNRVDELPPFLGCHDQVDNCEVKELIMVGKNGGRRVFLKATRKPEFFAGLESILDDMKRPPAKLKYWLARSVPGLEILFADNDFRAETVWKEGDLRLLVQDVRKKEEPATEDAPAAEDAGEEPDENYQEMVRSEIVERANKDLVWYRFADGGLAEPAAQPSGAQYLLVRDGISPDAGSQRWKVVGGGIELRSNETGLYKVSGGRATKIREGIYMNPAISSDGRWAIATTYNEESYTAKLVRINIATGKEFPVNVTESFTKAIAFVPGFNRFLVGYPYEHHYGVAASEAVWVDPATGRVEPAIGEVRPLMQQTFRQLQASSSGDFWAAVPDNAKNETVVGLYNKRTLKFTPRLTLPKIKFDSMKMYVEESEGKAYFVYQGHLLSVPLGQNRER